MLTFFQALVHAQLPGIGFSSLLEMLVAPIAKKSSDANAPVLHKQVCFCRLISLRTKCL